MEARSIEALVEAMWAVPGEEVYAVLDSARDPLVNLGKRRRVFETILARL